VLDEGTAEVVLADGKNGNEGVTDGVIEGVDGVVEGFRKLPAGDKDTSIFATGMGDVVEPNEA
jgi:hypothetical protein